MIRELESSKTATLKPSRGGGVGLHTIPGGRTIPAGVGVGVGVGVTIGVGLGFGCEGVDEPQPARAPMTAAVRMKDEILMRGRRSFLGHSSVHRGTLGRQTGVSHTFSAADTSGPSAHGGGTAGTE